MLTPFNKPQSINWGALPFKSDDSPLHPWSMYTRWAKLRHWVDQFDTRFDCVSYVFASTMEVPFHNKTLGLYQLFQHGPNFGDIPSAISIGFDLGVSYFLGSDPQNGG